MKGQTLLNDVGVNPKTFGVLSRRAPARSAIAIHSSLLMVLYIGPKRQLMRSTEIIIKCANMHPLKKIFLMLSGKHMHEQLYC